MHDGPIVLKFGGTSVADAAAFERVATIVRECRGPRVVVVSALGGMTDALLGATTQAAAAGAGHAFAALSPQFSRHEEIIEALVPGGSSHDVRVELANASRAIAQLLERCATEPAQRAALIDEIAAYGERLASSLLAAVLTAHDLPAVCIDPRSCIVTDSKHGRAIPIREATYRRTCESLEPHLAGGRIPVVGGFIGATEAGATTTLGRGGSDYTAALLGAALRAAEIQVWTDVPGVLTADPRLVAEARAIPVLSYAEAAELAFFGAKVLHPKTLAPARDHRIPIRTLSTLAPDVPGTLITDEAHIWPGTVKSIAHRSGITVVQVTSGRMLGAAGFLHVLFEVFDRHRTAVDVVSTSEVSVSLTVDDTTSLPKIVEELRALGEVSTESGRAVICVVGEGLRTTPGIAARIFRTIPDVNVSLISQGASRLNMTFVIDERQVGDAVQRLHRSLLEEPTSSAPPVRTANRRTDRQLDVVSLARDLIDIPSVSGDEAEVTAFVATLLEGFGYRVDQFDAAPGRPNLLAYNGEHPRLVFCTHLDTVPPHLPSHEDGESVLGRGACDAKGIAAAQILAAERLRAGGVKEVGLLFVADEELASLGARSANAHPRARECRYVVVGEPTDNRLAVGSRGSLQFRLSATGPGGHAGFGDAASSAVHRLLDALDDLRRSDWPTDPYFGATTLHIGTIRGGTAPNVLATDAQAELQIRLVTSAEPIKAMIERAVGDRAHIAYGSITQPMRLPAVSGFETCVVGFTTDVPHLSNWGTGFLLGPGSIRYAHSAGERIAKTELRRGVDLYVQLAETLLESDPVTPSSAATAERT